MSSRRVSVFPHNKPTTSSRVFQRSLSRDAQYKIHKISLIYVSDGMCRSIQTLVPSWQHHKRSDQVCTETRPGCSLLENARVDFLLVVNRAGETKKERTRQDGEGKSALSMHSHPFDHSSSISDLDLECNSRQEVRGTRLNGWRGKRIKCLELKLKALGRRNKERLDISRTKRKEKIKEKEHY